jgi:hypothetical protein
MSDLTKRLAEKLAFVSHQPSRPSEFCDTIINASVPHGLRDEPAWTYAIEDANRGARLENARLAPIHAAMLAVVEAAEWCAENHLPINGVTQAALAKLEAALEERG